jgi:hypothetical protein
MAAAHERAPGAVVELKEKRPLGTRLGVSRVGMKEIFLTSLNRRPRRGGLRRWWARKWRRKLVLETRPRQRLQTREARGREEGCGGEAQEDLREEVVVLNGERWCRRFERGRLRREARDYLGD